MEINFQYVDRQDQLSYLIQKLVAIIRYENTFTFQLLKIVTISKKAVIEIDDCRLQLSATDDHGYTLHVKKNFDSSELNYKSKSMTLRQVMAGLITVDKAIANQDFSICGSFKDTINIYKLLICILSDSILSHRMRNLWQEFMNSWEENKIPLPFTSYENQSAIYDKWIQKIPVNVFEMGM